MQSDAAANDFQSGGSVSTGFGEAVAIEGDDVTAMLVGELDGEGEREADGVSVESLEDEPQARVITTIEQSPATVMK